MGLMTIAYACVGFPVSAFGEYCMALTGAAGIFSSSAVIERFASPKAATPVD